MPDWNQISNELGASGSTHDVVRRKYLKKLQRLTSRNVIIYYSGWLQKPDVQEARISDEDKIGFMTATHQLDRSKGLDLVLHTPGGDTAATESLVEYLRAMFGTDIRAIVPQLAMSGGTMIACSARLILMGRQSSLGPIDPQFGMIPAHGVVEEFNRAIADVKRDPARIPIWQPIIAKYSPAFIGECEKAIAWSIEMTEQWLRTGMFKDDPDREAKIQQVVQELTDHALTKSHGRHLPLERCREMGLSVQALEEDDRLQDAVLSVHHACMHTLTATNAFKIIENHLGKAFIKSRNVIIARG